MSRFIAIASTVLALSLVGSAARAQSSIPPLADLAGREQPATDLVPRPQTTLSNGSPRGRAELSLVVGVVRRPQRHDITASALLTLPLPEWLGMTSAEPSPRPLGTAPPLRVSPSHAASRSVPTPAVQLAFMPAPAAVPVRMAYMPASVPAQPDPQQEQDAPALWLPRLTNADVRAAIEASRHNASETAALERLDDMVTRARWSSLMPELRLRATRLVDESASYAPTSYDEDRTTSSGGVSLWLEGRATWRLDRALFADQELRAEQQRRQLNKARQQVALQTSALLFGWLGAVYSARDPLRSAEQCLDAWIREQRLAAELELLTSGWHRRWLSRKPALALPWCVEDLQTRGAEHAPSIAAPDRSAAHRPHGSSGRVTAHRSRSAPNRSTASRRRSAPGSGFTMARFGPLRSASATDAPQSERASSAP